MDSERGGVCNPAANVLGEITPSDMAQNLSQRSPDVAALRHNPGRQCLTQSVLWFVASSPDGTKWNPGFLYCQLPGLRFAPSGLQLYCLFTDPV